MLDDFYEAHLCGYTLMRYNGVSIKMKEVSHVIMQHIIHHGALDEKYNRVKEKIVHSN